MRNWLRQAGIRWVAQPVAVGAARLAIALGRLPRAHGVRFASCVGDGEALRSKSAAALQLLEQIDAETYRNGCLRWRALLVRPLGPATAVRWQRSLNTIELDERLVRTWHIAGIAGILAEQAALQRLWRTYTPKETGDVERLRKEAQEYQQWFYDRLPPDLLKAAIEVGAV
jgi:hypothetical protein